MRLARRLSHVIAVAVAAITPLSAQIDETITQLIVSIAPDWNDHRGVLVCLERRSDRWLRATPIIPVLYGKNGLAWGRGAVEFVRPGPHKIEGDGRAPAGLFAIGKIFGYADQLPDGADFPFHQVTDADAWIDDPSRPDYNRHITVDSADPPDWFESQRMRLGDDAFRWKIEIRHNADSPEPGAGSAIFFHIRRGPARPTAGCTTMAEDDLVGIIRWLREASRPHYLLLPQAEYDRLVGDWKLPVIRVPVVSTRLRPAQRQSCNASPTTRAK